MSLKYRSGVGQVSVKYRSCIDQLSVKCRSSIGHVSVEYRRWNTVSVDTTIGRLSVDISADSRPTVDRLSVDSRPIGGGLSADYRPIVGRISESQSTDIAVDIEADRSTEAFSTPCSTDIRKQTDLTG